MPRSGIAIELGQGGERVLDILMSDRVVQMKDSFFNDIEGLKLKLK